MPRQPIRQIGVGIPVWERLRNRQRPGQSIPGVITELLDLADKVEGKTQTSIPAGKPVSETPDKPENIVEKW